MQVMRLSLGAQAYPGLTLLHDEVGLERAGGFDRLQDGDHAARLDAETVEAGDQRAQAGAADDGDLAAGFVDGDLRLRRDDGLAVAERGGLRDLRRLGDAHVERAVGDGDRRDLHILADDDGAGARIDDDARRRVGINQEIADRRHQPRRADGAGAQQFDGARVALEGDRAPEGASREGVDGVDDPRRGGVIGVAQLQEHAHLVERAVDGPLDDGAVGDAAGGRHALRNVLGLAGRVEAGDGDGALGAGVRLAVGAGELRQQKRAAHQRSRVAERGDGHVETLAWIHAERHVGGDDDGGDVLVAHRVAAHRKAHLFEHGLQGVIGERGVAQGIAGALQADDEAVADELGVASAAQRGNVLDAHGGVGADEARQNAAARQAGRASLAAHQHRAVGAHAAGHGDAGILVAQLHHLPDDAILQRIACSGDDEAVVDVDHRHRGARAHHPRRPQRRHRDRQPRQQRAPGHHADDVFRRQRDRAGVALRRDRRLDQHVGCDEVAGVDHVFGRGRAHLLRERRRAETEKHAGGQAQQGERSAHGVQLRMLEMVPAIWSAAWITLEFIS